MPLGADSRARIAAWMASVPEGALAVAVSGGSDSLALLHLLAECGPVRAVTVDHGLRPEAADEARQVARACAALNVPHDTLRWSWDGQGNLQARAREARRQLIANWAAPLGITHVALGHTLEDQAETFLMRLAREAGVDGLSGMAEQVRSQGVTWIRPLLGCHRCDLRAYLTARGVAWAEDPSNEDTRFDRVKARQAMAALAPLGIDAPGLARVSAQMADAREALNLHTAQFARAHAQTQLGDVVVVTEALLQEPAEIRRRFISHALLWVNSAGYTPRREAIARLLSGIAQGQGATLQGCRILVSDKTVRITREYQAVADLVAPLTEIWDGRWQATGPEQPGLELRALGPDGQAQCPHLREMGLPHATRLALPGLWRGATLLAAPLGDLGGNWHVGLRPDAQALPEAIQSH